MFRLLISLCFICLCIAQDDLYLKIAEKAAIPHYARHGYEYPTINFNGALGNRGQQGSVGGRQRFSQPDPFNQPTTPVRQPEPFNRPVAPVRQSSPIRQQPFSGQSNSNQPIRQTRFFNLYTPNSNPGFRSQFGLERRES